MINKRKTIIISSLLAFQLSFISLAHADQNLKDDHELHEISYEVHLQIIEGTIEEHERMIKSYEAFLVSDDNVPKKRIKKIIKHCNTLISDSKELREEILEFSKWHKKKEREDSK